MAAGTRTELFRLFRRALRLSLKPYAPAKEFVESRRTFLKKSAAVAGAGLLSSCGTMEQTPRPGPRIAIVGAGVAGLNAAWQLKKKGLAATIYESSNRVGGRMYSAKDLMAPGLVTELGGEFIDSNHEDMLALCREFDLKLWDVDESHKRVTKDAYLFGGRTVTEAEVIAAFRPLAPRLKPDIARCGDVDFENPGQAGPLDNTSISGYLDKIGVTGWFRSLVETAFVTEYGLEADEQSCLNLLTIISADVEDKFEPFGESDERYKVSGGNLRVCTELARRLRERIRLERRLEAIRTQGQGFTLSFRDPQGRSFDVDADYVILTLPFTTLRVVDIRVDLPPIKRKAISELGYGSSAKLLIGVKKRVWSGLGFRGDCFTDEPFQMAWDNSMCQPGEAGGLTVFQGGRRVAELGKGAHDAQVARLIPGVEKLYPGITAALSGRNSRFMWPTHPHALGGYACYKPGQWTTIAGAEIKPVGQLLFAGEHCSRDFQGFMNGSAETGRRAAESILAAVLK
ncbi:MAG TPA: FAD-dependent oxidoreductase [Planctomycetota bacterium]|nr:FAD-dependent oxidoreductase [Planctomycetota bacterium]